MPAVLFGCLLLAAACGANRVPRQAGQTPAPGVEKEAVEPPPPVAPDPAQLHARAVQRLIDESQELFEQGEAHFRRGEAEQGREYFRRALATLKESGLDFFSNPRLERSYYQLLDRIQELELAALVDPVQILNQEGFEILFGRREEAAIDEIGDVNLFTIAVDPTLQERISEELLRTRFDIPVVLNERVLKFLEYYQGRGRNFMEEGLRRAGRYLPLFIRTFEEEGLPLDLIFMAHVESLFKPKAYSRAHAVGIWQFISGTGRKYGLRQDWWVDERRDVVKSTRAAARYLKDLYALFGDWHLALAAYNVGEGRIGRILERYGPMDYWTMVERNLLPRETRNYVPSILASLIIFKQPHLFGFSVEAEPEIEFELAPVGEQVDLRTVSELIEVPLSELAELNPELRRGVTPFEDEDYRLKVPSGTADLLVERLAELPPEKRVKFAHHRVAAGETLSLIASRYSAPVGLIAEVNRIRNIHRISVGQDLIIPLSGYGGSRALSVSAGGGASRYVVRRGDSLFKIARSYGVTIEDLLRWNNLRRNQLIYPGQTLRILSASGGGSE